MRTASVLAAPSHSASGAREGLTLAAMCLGAMMTFLQITASASALSAIQEHLRISPGTLVWIPSAYTLLVASPGPVRRDHWQPARPQARMRAEADAYIAAFAAVEVTAPQGE
jgi:hypothetical protein